ncbi:PPOX class F420-dependent oxidoreductase [Thermopolyspora sp. NPDC052614]|uniref:PPOX class F420-dependent oxidoreductase n=1 Tax=Thermopolyspora sp. NPDC052614 TaxID=3155682 RepID=UPI003442F81F
MTFTQAELNYLEGQRLGRLATVAPDGQPQNNPVAFFVDAESGTITIGGYAMGTTKKFKNVQQGSAAALVVDDLASVNPWTVRGIEIRGTAVALTDHEPPVPSMSREIIKITPTRIISWGLDGARSSRKA